MIGKLPAYLPAPAAPALRRAVALAGPVPLGYLGALVALAVLVQLRASWAAELLLVPVLLTVPGLLLLRALRVPGAIIGSCPVYVPGASLVVLLGTGLVTDLAGPLAGVAQPLRPEPLLTGLEIVCLALLAAGLRAGPEADVAIPWRTLGGLAWPLALPLVAAAGALRLNSGDGDTVAVVAVAGCAVVLIGSLALAARLRPALLPVVIYAASLALMWGFSLRGQLVYGFDIAAEYHAMEQTVQAGVWHTSHVGDAYGAMLSVTVLPAELHALSGLSGLLVFKVVYPAVGALFPVAIYYLGRRVLTRRWAFAAAALVLAQQTFFQQLPGLARQEIAFVLFVVLVLAVLDRRLPGRSQLALVALLGLAMAVSHYSTTYFAIVMFALGLALQWLLSWARRMPRISPALAVGLVAVAACAAVWYGLVTRSASNLSQFVAAAQSQGLDLLPSKAGGLLARYLQAGASNSVSAAQYASTAHLYYLSHYAFVQPLPDAGARIYALRNAPALVAPPVRWSLGLTALSKGELIVEQLVNLGAAVGALIIVLRRKTTVVGRQVGLLGLASLVILAVLRFSGTVASAYNPERAFLQALVVLAIALCWGLQTLAGRTRKRRAAVFAVAAVAVAVVLVNTSGLANQVLGGGTDTNLANDGPDYEQFYMTTPELATARWLGREAPPGQFVYADRYGELRLLAMIGNRTGLLYDITPLTLDQHAWVYVSRTNLVDRTGVGFLNNESASYTFPFGFLDHNFDIVYTNGTSEVFHG